MRQLSAALAVLLLISTGCASLDRLGALVQPPTFDEVPGRPPEIRLLAPAADRPLGGAGVRLWTRVSNPNPFGFTLRSLRGTLYLDEASAGAADLPLGLALEPRADTTFPIDITVSFADLPGLADTIRRAARREPIAYRLDGTVAVDAGRLGTPSFGPMTLLRGTTR
jgi:hypothetical protein